MRRSHHATIQSFKAGFPILHEKLRSLQIHHVAPQQHEGFADILHGDDCKQGRQQMHLDIPATSQPRSR